MTEPIIVRLDLAPAFSRLTPADGEEQTFQKSRVIVSDDRVYVFIDSPRGPVLTFEGRLESLEGRNTTGYQAITATGDAVYFKRSGGCACGSQLKSFRPFSQGMVQGAYTMT